MLRELPDVSAEARMGGDLFNSWGDAFHKKITIRQGVLPPRGFDYAGNAGNGPDDEELTYYVAHDSVAVPPEIEVIAIVEFEEGDTVGFSRKELELVLYQDVHTHGLATDIVGGIPVTPIKIE